MIHSAPNGGPRILAPWLAAFLQKEFNRNMAKLALRFISGKYKGGEFLLREGKEIIIGRSSDVDIVLVEDMVSRQHAVIVVKDDKLFISDKGSTNGTFVNGEKITNATASLGDRILVGTSIMKVVNAADETSAVETQNVANAPPQTMPGARQTLSRQPGHSGARSMSGTISEVPLPDLIQLFNTSKKTGTLLLSHNMVVAKIHLEQGRIVYASISDQPNLEPLKAMFRILAWEDGDFDLVGPEPHPAHNLIELPTEHVLMEGLRQLDEMRHAQSKLPPEHATITVALPLEPSLSALKTEELDVLQLLLGRSLTIRKVLDNSPRPDNETTEILQKLIKHNYLQLDDFL